MLSDYMFYNLPYNENKIIPEESIASELSELKLEIMDSNNNTNITNDLERKQFVEEKIKTRNQAVQKEFRKRLLDNNINACSICGYSFSKFLIAGHIKPYALCDNTLDAINQYNGLLMCPNHDRLFESAKFMTIDKDTGEIKLNEEARESKEYGMLQGKKINMSLISKRKDYLKWHNEKFEENNKN